jgi:hypothetical protein
MCVCHAFYLARPGSSREPPPLATLPSGCLRQMV